MPFRVSNLTSLKSAHIMVAPALLSGTYTAGSSFNLPLLVRNAGRRSVAWSAAHPLNLGYRWINEVGEFVERDGGRTNIPAPPAPKSEIAVTLWGRTPTEPGNYRLQASLVLEGVHWACDVAEHGWTDLPVQVLPIPAWPQELRGSAGGQALRGAIARAALARSLEGNISHVQPKQAGFPSVELPTEGLKVLPEASSPPIVHGNSFRNWVRRTLGIRNVQRDLELVANAISRQEQRTAELQSHLERIETMLGEGSNAMQGDLEKLAGVLQGDLEKLAGALRKQHIFSKSSALEVRHNLAAIRTELRDESENSRRLLSNHEQFMRALDTLQMSLEERKREAE